MLQQDILARCKILEKFQREQEEVNKLDNDDDLEDITERLVNLKQYWHYFVKYLHRNKIVGDLQQSYIDEINFILEYTSWSSFSVWTIYFEGVHVGNIITTYECSKPYYIYAIEPLRTEKEALEKSDVDNVWIYDEYDWDNEVTDAYYPTFSTLASFIDYIEMERYKDSYQKYCEERAYVYGD